MQRTRAAGYPDSLLARRGTDGRFANLGGHPTPTLPQVLRWKLGLGPREPTPEAGRGATGAPAPRVAPDLARVHAPDPSRVQLTWIGHATWLIQAGGVALLTDPMFSRDCSPYPVPRIPRRVEPGLTIAELPRIDAVLLSHGHYDHCDAASLRALRPAHGVATPHGLAPVVRACTDSPVFEAEWGDRLEGGAPGARFALTCVPAQHATARSAFDRNIALWCGWLIEIAGRRIWFTGDTAFAEYFGALGEWTGGADVALLPIGAYRPRWFMRSVHCDPAEAVAIHRALRARRSLAMHWGTFDLTDEPLDEPPLVLASAARDAGLAPGEFTAPPIGATVVV